MFQPNQLIAVIPEIGTANQIRTGTFIRYEDGFRSDNVKECVIQIGTQQEKIVPCDCVQKIQPFSDVQARDWGILHAPNVKMFIEELIEKFLKTSETIKIEEDTISWREFTLNPIVVNHRAIGRVFQRPAWQLSVAYSAEYDVDVCEISVHPDNITAAAVLVEHVFASMLNQHIESFKLNQHIEDFA